MGQHIIPSVPLMSGEPEKPYLCWGGQGNLGCKARGGARRRYGTAPGDGGEDQSNRAATLVSRGTTRTRLAARRFSSAAKVWG